QRALGLGRERDHLAARARVGLAVDVLQVGRLPAQAGAVIDDLAVDLARKVVDEGHAASAHQSLKRLSMSSSVISPNGAWFGSVAFFASAAKMTTSCSHDFFTRRRTRPRLVFL